MDGQLNNQLLNKEEEFRGSLPAEHEILMKSIEYLKQSGAANGLRAGDTAPDFTLTDAFGATVSLREHTAKGPVILTFYRGSWFRSATCSCGRTRRCCLNSRRMALP